MDGQNYNPVFLALLGSLTTWACTSLGSAGVFVEKNRRLSGPLMEGVFGLSAGVMLAASFFSLLAPALNISRTLSYPAWIPLLSGFLLGVAFIKVMDIIVPESPEEGGCFALCITRPTHGDIEEAPEGADTTQMKNMVTADEGMFKVSKQMFILALAVTIHNIPEGLALGAAYGGIGVPGGPDIHDALVLTIALALQNLPEGLAISVPIWRAGSSKMTSFCYGQISGFVEVIAAVLGALLVMSIQMILPYALSFAAGAMIYVVCKELIPASQKVTKQWGITGIMFGFALMMTLDIAFD